MVFIYGSDTYVVVINTGGSDSDETPDSPDPGRVVDARHEDSNLKKRQTGYKPEPSQSTDTQTDKGILANSIISEFFSYYRIRSWWG